MCMRVLLPNDPYEEDETKKKTIGYCWTVLRRYIEYIRVLHHLSNRWINRGTKVTHDLYKYKPWHKKRVLHSTISNGETGESEAHFKMMCNEFGCVSCLLFSCALRVCSVYTVPLYNRIPIIFAPNHKQGTSHLERFSSCTLSLAKRELKMWVNI